MFSIQNLSFRYGRRKQPVLVDFSLDLGCGGIYGLLGPNGAGKSTLLYLLMGALTPAAGTVTYTSADGSAYNVRRRLPRVLADIILIPEEFDMPDLTARDYGRLYGALYPGFSEEMFVHNLEVMGMDHNGTQKVRRMSMGQKKRVFISFALACNTRTIIMDEPTNGLDIQAKAAFRRLLAEQMTDDRLFLISTHQVRDLDQVLDRIIIMNDRRVIVNSPVFQIQSRLKFLSNIDSAAAASALYAVPSAGGMDAMFVNDDDAETNLNLELLFDFSLREPDRISSILNK